MKKLLLGCLALIVVVILGAIGFVASMDSEFAVTRTATIHKTPDQVYSIVSDLHTWPDWTAWDRETDPTCVWTFEGPDAGEGASMSWKGDVHGEGSLTIGTCVPGKEINYTLTFQEEGGETVSHGKFTMIEAEDGTAAVWVMSGEMTGALKLLIPLMDTMVGPMFEVGLVGLEGVELTPPAEPDSPE